MGLNIKNERVHDLAREAAARTGQSQTSAIEAALRSYLAALDDDGAEQERLRDIDELIAEMQRRWRDSPEPPFRAEDLYDPHTGLPA